MPSKIIPSVPALFDREKRTITAQAAMPNTHALPAIPSVAPIPAAVNPETVAKAAPKLEAAEMPSV